MKVQGKKNIYVVFFSTNTKMGSFIQIITKHNYNHVAIAFDEDLKRMYSFARYYKNAPLVGGFVEEALFRYYSENRTFLNIKVCKLPVSEQSYQIINEQIQKMRKEKECYIYNTLSAMSFLLHKRIRIKKAYTCIEFVVSLLCRANILEKEKRFYTIKELEHTLEQYEVYEGNLFDFATVDAWGNDRFYVEKSLFYNCKATVLHFGKLLGRLAFR